MEILILLNLCLLKKNSAELATAMTIYMSKAYNKHVERNSERFESIYERLNILEAKTAKMKMPKQ